MDNLSPADAGHTTRPLTFTAVLLVLLAQLYLFVPPADDDITKLPAAFWIYLGVAASGALLAGMAQLFRPARHARILPAAATAFGARSSDLLALSLSFIATMAIVFFSRHLWTFYAPVTALR